MSVSPFESVEADSINVARGELLRRVLPQLISEAGLNTALDVGCGALGYFSALLAELGLEVSGSDGRQENVDEAQRRNPALHFERQDIEDPQFAHSAAFDLVLCLGLLYHLENPFRAVRNLFALSRKCVFIETQTAPADSPSCMLFEEPRARNQSLTYMALIPTRNAFVQMLYQSGFAAVYQLARGPVHPQFQSSLLRRSARIVLLASREIDPKLDAACLRLGFNLIPRRRPVPAELDNWNTVLGSILRACTRPRASAGHMVSRMLGALPARLVRGFCSAIAPAPPLRPWPDWHLGVSQSSRTPGRLFRRLLWKRLSFEHSFVAPWHFGTKIRIMPDDEMGREVFVSGFYEPNELSFLEKTLRPGMVFLDIGANAGLYTLFASSLVGPQGTVVSLEPSRREFQRLCENLRLNQSGNVRALPLAASDVLAKLELLVAENSHCGHNTLGSFAYENVAAEARQPVSTTTLDTLVKEQHLARVDVIKIDVEGHEWFVLQGARDTLARFRPVLLLEVCEPALARQGCSGVQIRAFLAEQGYELLGFDPHTGVPAPLVGESGANILAVSRQSAAARAAPAGDTARAAVR